MPEQSHFTGVFRGFVNPDGRRITVKRNRKVLSCSACRVRKLRCSRNQPCESCARRGEGPTCDFNSIVHNTTGTAPKSNFQGKKSAAEAQERLRNLEEMVNEILQSSTQPANASTSSADDSQMSIAASGSAKHSYCRKPEAISAEHLSKGEGRMVYVGATHWATILEQISDIQGYFDSSKDDVEDKSFTTYPSNVEFFLGTPNKVTIADVLTWLPPREITDNLMSFYFTTANLIAVSWLHTTNFRREYEAFWVNPDSVSLMWISSLLSVLSIATKIAVVKKQEITVLLAENFTPLMFRTRAGQCLVSGDYLTPQPYVIEGLLLHIHSAFILNDEEQNKSWAILGVTIRLAQQMGYHRDPEYLPAADGITPYEAEMRRRVWMYIDIFDVLLSLKLGLPSVIHDEECDTQPASNLWDEDFDELSDKLPVSRPYTDATTMLFPCYKSRYVRLLRRISRLTMSTKRPNHDELMRLNDELQVVHDEVPPSLKIQSINSTSFGDDPNMIVKRIMVEMLYLKSLCILHRPYLIFNRSSPNFELSRKACKQAAFQLLDIQIKVYQECLPGGRLFEERWTIFSSTLYDFLLAATIVCLDVSEAHITG